MSTLRATEAGQKRTHYGKRGDLAQLCRLAFDYKAQIPSDLSPVFDQEVEFGSCQPFSFGGGCSLGFVPLVLENQSYEPLIVFQKTKFANLTLYECIEQGQCPCSEPNKILITTLPACAAAAAGNFKLCRFLLRSFFRPDIHVKQQKILANNWDRHLLFEQVVHHLIYYGHCEEALRTLNDTEIHNSTLIDNDSKLSFMETALKGVHHDIFWQLVDRFGVNIEGDLHGPTPLFLAVAKGTVRMARELLRKGADCKTNCLARMNGMNILEVAISRDSSSKMAIMLLEENFGQYVPQNTSRPSVMQAAIKYGRYALVDYLLDRGYVTVPIKVGLRATVCVPVVSWCCVHINGQKMAKYLVQKGLDCVSPISLPYAFGCIDTRTPLQALTEYSYPDQELIDLLIERDADVNGRTPHGDTPLSLAMKKKNINTVKQLLYAGAILDSPTPFCSSFQLYIADDRKEGKYSFLWYALVHNEYNMAEMALAAGYRARREPWFVKGDFPKNTPQDVIEKLERLSLRPLSLKCLSIRTLKEIVGGSLLKYLGQVDLGSVYNDDILLKNLVKMYQTEQTDRY